MVNVAGGPAGTLKRPGAAAWTLPGKAAGASTGGYSRGKPWASLATLLGQLCRSHAAPYKWLICSFRCFYEMK